MRNLSMEWAWLAKDSNVGFRGGRSLSTPFAFHRRELIDKKFVQLYGESVLADFRQSPFASLLVRGGYPSPKGRTRKITAEGVATGWFRNRDVWDNYMIVNPKTQLATFSPQVVFTLNSSSHLMAELFASDADPLPTEVKSEIHSMFSDDWEIESFLDFITANEITVDAFGQTLRAIDYAERITRIHDNYNSSIFEELKREWGGMLGKEHAWGWALLANEDYEFVDSILYMAKHGITPLEYSNAVKAGVGHPEVVVMQRAGTIDSETARAISSGIRETAEV